MARRTVAVALLLLAVWFWALPFFFPVSSRAVVNAQVVQIRAPINGEVAALAVGVGDRIALGDQVLRVAGRDVDGGPLAVARARHSDLVARHGRLASELETTVTAHAVCEADLGRYKNALVEILGQTCREGRVKVEMAELEHQVAERRAGRMSSLASNQAVGVFEHDDTRDAAKVSKSRIEQEKVLLERVEKELHAVQKGVFVNRETPFYQVQEHELSAKITRIKGDLAETTELIAAAERGIRTEEDRMNRLASTAVPAPVSGVVWKRPGTLHQVVERNETVLNVADEKTVFVEALLHQRHLSSVGPGCRATICLTGGETLTGRVHAVRTPDPTEAERAYAVALTDGDVRQVKVIIELEGASPDVALVGRHARVLITGAEPSKVEQGVEWLFSRLRF
ncbi:HlyD family secretion protein [Limnoglobus roseus]|nr:HlyD family efflux transporter periplasmic adaptor subunit [Limnoglobus roseus]